VGSTRAFTIRPEKIRMLPESAVPGPGECSLAGRIRDVVYLGMHTRYVVEVGEGTVLTVVEQNRETTSVDVHGHRGRGVRLAWNPAHNHVLGA
jgi:ABC-type Fe3+/spermidine/putrescine transport system ATPase subunit